MKETLKLWVILMTLAAVFILASVQPAAAKTEPAVITLWHALPQEHTPLFEEMVNEFSHTAHGLFRIEFRRFESQAQLHLALLQGTERPDIALIDTRWQEAIVRRNKIIAMEDLAKSKVGSSVMIVMKLDTFSQMWEASKLEGKLISLPFTGYNRALIVNESLLTASGAKAPQNWGELVAMGKKLAASPTGDQQWPFLIPVDEGNERLADFFEVLLWQNGKEIIEPFDSGKLAAFDSPESKAVLRMLVDMIQKHKIAPSTSIDKGSAVMFVGTPGDYLSLTRQGKTLNVIRWPGKRDTVNDMVVYSFIVFDKGRDSSLTDKIWHSIYQASEFKAMSKWALSTPYLPNNKQVTLSPQYFEYLGQYPGMKTFLAQLKNSRVAVRDEARTQVLQILGENLRLALKGQLTPEQALDQAEDKANLILDPAGSLRAKKAEMDMVNSYVDKVWNK